MKNGLHIVWLLCLGILLNAGAAGAQQASVKARVDANRIAVGDQIKLFIEATHNLKDSRLQWAAIPDTFNTLEVVERGKIDTLKQGDQVTLKQRLLITGFDSGIFRIPSFHFPVIPANGAAYTLPTDSFDVLVQTIAVDTTQPYKGIKDIITIERSWRDYLPLIGGGLLLILLAIFIIYYFRKNKKVAAPVVERGPAETLQQKTLRQLSALEQQQLWQAGRIKEYYVQLTDILRSYIEERFRTPALELTTDELLQKAMGHPELRPHYDRLAQILYTADLAKFAKAQPLPQEHTQAMDQSRQFVSETIPTVTQTTQQP